MSSLPSPAHFSALDVNAATDTLCSTLISSLDNICPLSSRSARAAPSNSWLSDVLHELRTQGSREKMAQIYRSVRPDYLLVFAFIFLCWSPHCQGFILPQQDQQHIWHAISSKHSTLSSLSYRHLPQCIQTGSKNWHLTFHSQIATDLSLSFHS